MRRILLALILVMLCLSDGEAQWRKVADFMGKNDAGIRSEFVTCIYFLDLPGPPRIGFVGTASELYRTSDGGDSWSKVWGDGAYWAQFVRSISFEDSLNGWFCFSLGDTDMYRTTDGGLSWKPVILPMNPEKAYGPNSLYYCSGSGRLLVAMGDSERILCSTNRGESWNTSIRYGCQSFSFSSPLNGIIPTTFADNAWGFLYTRDGGITWDSSIVGQIAVFQPLAIRGTPICFACGWDSETVILRSDDYGAHWRKIYDFGPRGVDGFPPTSPYATGIIGGSLERLYIQSDFGTYLSTDEGESWKLDGGPIYDPIMYNDHFYSDKGVTFMGGTYDDNGLATSTGLWRKDDNVSGVAAPVVRSSSDFSATIGERSVSPSGVEVVLQGGRAGDRITAEMYDLLGIQQGESAVLARGADPSEHVTLTAPQAAGAYFIVVSDGGERKILRFVRQ